MHVTFSLLTLSLFPPRLYLLSPRAGVESAAMSAILLILVDVSMSRLLPQRYALFQALRYFRPTFRITPGLDWAGSDGRTRPRSM